MSSSMRFHFDFDYVDARKPQKRRRLTSFYRERVRRQLCLNGGGRIHLSKNPYWTGRVEALIEASRKKLAEQSPQEKKHTTRFRYSLEEFGLEAEPIRAELGVLFERFGWDDSAGEKHTASERGAG